ncbi:MAG: alpha/beta hydrolase [Spirochaetota bacterium]
MYTISKIQFESNGCILDACLYEQKSNKKLPVVVMAHGFGARMAWGLHPFADAFAQMGFAILMFDYRGFGKSQGSIPRLVYHKNHIQDYLAAISFVKTLPNIEPSKIILWGTSYSGGHVLSVASNDTTIAGVIAQVPFIDGLATAFNLPVKNIVQGMYFGLRDMIHILLHKKPYSIPIVSTPDTFAAMNTPESYEGYLKLVPPEDRNEAENNCPARICLTLPLNRPIVKVASINCPVCIIAAEYDSLIPLKAVKKAASKITHADFNTLPCGHFDPYTGNMFEKSIAIQKRFLQQLHIH